MKKEDFAGSDLADSRLISLTTDVVQDHPTAWDWRLVLGFVAVGAVAFYWL